MPHGDYAKELEAYVKGAGIPPLDVIGWATRNGAELLGTKDELGTIETCKLADLLMVSGDPVKDITILQNRDNLEVVMKDGKFVENKLTQIGRQSRLGWSLTGVVSVRGQAGM